MGKKQEKKLVIKTRGLKKLQMHKINHRLFLFLVLFTSFSLYSQHYEQRLDSGLNQYSDKPGFVAAALNKDSTSNDLIGGSFYEFVTNSLKGVKLQIKDTPTIDGTASSVSSLSSFKSKNTTNSQQEKKYSYDKSGAIIRGDTSEKKISLLFSGHKYADGATEILKVLDKHGIKASFFLTGNFYRNKKFAPFIKKARKAGHYLGAHSNEHLLYNDWTEAKNILVSQEEFKADLRANYSKMEKFGIQKEEAPYFLPPYEWNDETITKWADQMNITLINYTPGTLSHADYTTPEMTNYRNTKTIMKSILSLEKTEGLNGFMLLSHLGTHPDRTDKSYARLDDLISTLEELGYKFEPLDNLLELEDPMNK